VQNELAGFLNAHGRIAFDDKIDIGKKHPIPLAKWIKLF